MISRSKLTAIIIISITLLVISTNGYTQWMPYIESSPYSYNLYNPYNFGDSYGYSWGQPYGYTQYQTYFSQPSSVSVFPTSSPTPQSSPNNYIDQPFDELEWPLWYLIRMSVINAPYSYGYMSWSQPYGYIPYQSYFSQPSPVSVFPVSSPFPSDTSSVNYIDLPPDSYPWPWNPNLRLYR